MDNILPTSFKHMIEILFLKNAYPFDSDQPEGSMRKAVNENFGDFLRLTEGEYDLTEKDNLVVFKDGRGLYRAMTDQNTVKISWYDERVVLQERESKMVSFPEDTTITGITEPSDNGGFGLKVIIVYRKEKKPSKK